MLVIKGVMNVYMKNLGCSPTSDVVDLEFILVHIHLNASDSSLKFHVLKMPKLHCYKPSTYQFKDF